jgi:tRNA dimethylallyltransferase
MPTITGPVLVLSGATAAGKTDTVLGLADRFDIDIISVDAAQVFRGMNIGTAKPEPEILRKYPHHLIDIRSPLEHYSAADFVCDANRLITTSLQNQRIPVLTGGTIFYISALINGLSALPEANAELRAEIEQLAEKTGWQAIHDELRQIDPTLAARLHSHDRQRLQRAFEIYRITGRPPSTVMEESKPKPSDWNIHHCTLFQPDRQVLHRRIETRFHQMLANGLVDEIETLRETLSVNRECVSMRSVGYRQVFNWLAGETDYDGMIASGIAATRQLAKRQLTWLRQSPGILWYDASHRCTLDHLSGFIDTLRTH